MRVSFGQLDIEPGVPFQNLERALAYVHEAIKQGSELILFPEMALPGYLLGDMWERQSFLRETLAAQNELIQASQGISILFGGLALDENKSNEDGRVRKYNALYLAQDGKVHPPKAGPYPFVIKTLMPNYREFDDSRHFYDTRKLALELGQSVESLINPFHVKLGSKNIRIGGVICEDAWDGDYSIKPSQILHEKGIDILCNLSCSPFTLGKENKRERVFGSLAKSLNRPLLYCNASGLQNNGKTVYTFDGDSTLYHANGKRSFTLDAFQAQLKTVELDASSEEISKPIEETEKTFLGLKYGTRKFMDQLGVQKVVIGLSGGIDSALAAAVYAQILEPEQLYLVNMPSRFNSNLTKSASAELAKNLGCYYGIASIQQSIDSTIEQLQGLSFDHLGNGSTSSLDVSSFVTENIQARDRSGRLLAAISACVGGVFTCNANKSETTIGYSTLYGDHAGFLANLADLWKSQVYAIAHTLNQQAGQTIIPDSIIKVKPSAELSDQQNPEKGQGDPLHYPYHDALFQAWVESWQRLSPEELCEALLQGTLSERLNIDEKLIPSLFKNPEAWLLDMERWWKLYNGMAVAKRIQAPPILAFSRRAFGFDHRETQSKVLWSQAYQTLKQKVLEQTSF